MNKSLLLLILLFVSSLLTGCWDRTEINDIALVTGVGIDLKNEKEIELIAEIHIPKTMGGGGGGGGGITGSSGSQTFVRRGAGNTIAEAISNLQEKLPREVFWGQTKVIVIGETMAKKGIRVPLDFLTRHPQPRLRSHVFIAEGTANSVLSLKPPLERSPSEVLRELASSEVLMNVTLKKLLQMLNGDGQSAAIPMITILSDSNEAKSPHTIAYVNQTAIFKKDKMVGRINDKLTRGVLWLRNEIKQANVSIKPQEGEGYVSTMLLRGNSKLVPKIEGGKWKMTVKAEAEEDVIVNGSNLDLMNPKIIQMLQKDMETDLRQRLVRTIEKIQKEMKVDILGFSEEFHRKYPKEWRKVKADWNEVFPSVQVTYEIKANIRRPGLATTPQGLPEDEVKHK
ncbi:MAG: germination protein Ger(x)C family [Paenibacillus sp.]|nr:germination protein Ger(x)C family [Paenibacillus sp.]